MRSANEIDFWRGLALLTIFVNHIPGFYFERFTYRNFGLSDSAELFVFLAGWSLRRLAGNGQGELAPLVTRVGGRAVQIYAAHMMITLIAIGLIAAASMSLDNPLVLEWHNAAAVFQDPVPTHLGLVILSHQLGYFDILPLYIVLMVCAPAMAVLHRVTPMALIIGSMGIYAAVLTLGWNLRTWPVEGYWYFNPFAWQLTFVLGFVLAGTTGMGGFVRRRIRYLRALGIVVVVAGAYAALSNLSPDPVQMPGPRLFFIFDKTYETPARLLHFMGVAAAFAGSFSLVLRFVPPLANYFSMLGRNSLNVFCVGSLASLIGQLVRLAKGNDILVDVVILLCGCLVLGLTAWVSELRERLKPRPSPLPSR
jgi:hypothetical protein